MVRDKGKERKGCLEFWKSSCLLFVFLPLLIFAAGVLIYQGLSRQKRDAELSRVNQDLDRLAQAIRQYRAEHQAWPGALEDLNLPDPPRDPFNKKDGTYQYLNIHNGEYVRVYSVGEDGVNSFSIGDPSRTVHPGEGTPVANEEFILALAIDRTKDDPENGMHLFLKAIQKFKQFYSPFRNNFYLEDKLVSESGWDTAMEFVDFYARAPHGPPSNISEDEAEEYLAGFINSGGPPKMKEFGDLLDKNQQAFEYVREGARRAKIESAFDIPYEEYVILRDYSMISLKFQLNARYMVSNGKRLESRGEYNKALDDYLALIPFSQSGAQPSTILGVLICNAAERPACDALQSLFMTGKLDPGNLEYAISRLEQFRSTEPDIAEMCENEHIGFKYNYDKDSLEAIKLSGTPINHFQFYKKKLWMNLNRSSYINENKAMMNLWTANLKGKSYREAIQSFPPERPSPANPKDPYDLYSLDYYNLYLWNGKYLLVQLTISWCHYNATLLMAGLAHHKAVQGRYPETLDAVADLFSEPPADPFTAGPFIYSATEAGFRLHSPGPDLADQGGALEYDPTNGTISDGDVVFGSTPPP